MDSAKTKSTVSSAGTVAEALAVVESDQPIDLLFTDLGLGEDGAGGLSIGQAFAKRRPGVPVLYSTGRGVTDGMTALFVEPHGSSRNPTPLSN